MMGVLSDAHGNWQAFDQGISVLKQMGATRFVFLGDALGYLPMPDVLDSIDALGAQIVCIRGNHEDLILKGGLNPVQEAVYQHERSRTMLSGRQLAAISAWPPMLELDFPVGRALFIHGSPVDHTYGYVYPDTDLRQFDVSAQYVFMGNTHRPFVRTEAGTLFVNAGSCGLPRDHGAFGSVALFDEGSGESKIIRFDIRQATAACLTQVTGIHEDVLALFSRQPEHYEGELFVH
ncbi:MAG: metallophosphoesterase family protein [Polaromonas sp.]|uniref:metallophosphoesterase family protein n=1 Tax=Polaromonas sp. TaxID=1869339 RepID=UPI0025F09468|nr:metallophosphoesterase family protein [Polaromonas sp.]MBI2725884.1 metallophosphoesterase family protein [Polaromonas sp.]